jgi:phosphatidylserine/phosphatidylglycerophosphate/cardiolipin synthase-like enzyme
MPGRTILRRAPREAPFPRLAVVRCCFDKQGKNANAREGRPDVNNWFDKTFRFNSVMIHSKVIVIDPFGKAPVVITGSHNLGPKASSKNDDNLVIIDGAPGLASEYAVNLLGVYGHYKYLYNQSLRSGKSSKQGRRSSPQYDGNFDDDKWQDWYRTGINLREINFWLG